MNQAYQNWYFETNEAVKLKDIIKNTHGWFESDFAFLARLEAIGALKFYSILEPKSGHLKD